MPANDAQVVATNDVPWIVESSEKLLDWLIKNSRGCDWTDESKKTPAIWRWTVGWIPYEGLFEDKWVETWFQDGINACLLRALEYEDAIRVCRTHSGDLRVHCLQSKQTYPLDSFLRGESLLIRNDPDLAEALSGEPVPRAACILDELGDYDFYWKKVRSQIADYKDLDPNGPSP